MAYRSPHNGHRTLTQALHLTPSKEVSKGNLTRAPSKGESLFFLKEVCDHLICSDRGKTKVNEQEIDQQEINRGMEMKVNDDDDYNKYFAQMVI